MTEPPAKKKRKSGGSFCSMGGCSNRSSRDSTSRLPNRDFLRFVYLPKDHKERQKWLARMKRDTRSWTPGDNTRVCSDHFFECDFLEGDLIRYRSRLSSDDAGGSKVTRIRLKPNSVPNTDRQSGRFVDPLDPTDSPRRPPPRQRSSEQVEQQVTEETGGVSDHASSPQQDPALHDTLLDSELEEISQILLSETAYLPCIIYTLYVLLLNY